MTPGPPPPRPIYLDIAPDPVFGLLHEPATSPLPTAVLIAPCWGWEAVASHRSLRAWAHHLATAGYATLRFDLPGTGDSGGSPRGAGRLDAWVAAVAAAADWLRGAGGHDRVATIGLGLGGLLAGKAVAEGAAIDQLVLWGAPARGKAFVREQRAFSELQASRVTADGEPAASGLPDGWLEAGGFVLSAETIEALGRVDLRTVEWAQLERALLLERDGAAVDAKLQASLEEAGVGVTTAAGEGWESMVFHPERPAPPEEVYARVTEWLAEGPAPAPAPAPRPTPRAANAYVVLDVDGERVRESVLTIQRPGASLVGILSEPVRDSDADLCAVFLNAGAVRRIGPNRLWVEASRRFAALGVPALRIDLEGIGDADGDDQRYRDVTRFYVPELVEQVGTVLDTLQASGIGRRFALIGLCSGGYWAFQAAVRDRRVGLAILVNSGALVWEDDLVTRREGRKVARLRQLTWWRKILHGEVTLARMWGVARAYGRRAVASLRQRAVASLGRARAVDDARVETSIDRGLDHLNETNTRLVLAFSAEEALHKELAEQKILARLGEWPNTELETLPGQDHTLRPIVAQHALHGVLDRQLDVELARPRRRARALAESLKAPVAGD